jgi:uncharacterized protein YjeT (DUF2065 family)
MGRGMALAFCFILLLSGKPVSAFPEALKDLSQATSDAVDFSR